MQKTITLTLFFLLFQSLAFGNEHFICTFEDQNNQIFMRGEIENESSLLVQNNTTGVLERALPELHPAFRPKFNINAVYLPSHNRIQANANFLTQEYLYIPKSLKLPFEGKLSSYLSQNGYWISTYFICKKSK